MTGDLRVLMKSRDQQVAEDFGKMAELGYIDKEFMMYGCAYWKNGRRYLVSSEAKKIYEFTLRATAEGLCPTSMMSLQKICQVPSGQFEKITQDVKYQLAKLLQETYPEEFFHSLRTFASKPANDSAKLLLVNLQNQIEGLYDADQLQLFSGLMQLAYEEKVLTLESYQELSDWLADIYKQMEDDVIVKDLFEKVFSGIVYEEGNGTIGYYSNAQKERVYERKLELENDGAIVSPIFSKACYYNYSYNINNAREDYKKYIRTILDQQYMNQVKAIKDLPSAIEKNEFLQQLDLIKEICGKVATHTFTQYGKKWHVLK